MTFCLDYLSAAHGLIESKVPNAKGSFNSPECIYLPPICRGFRLTLRNSTLLQADRRRFLPLVEGYVDLGKMTVAPRFESPAQL